MFGETILRLTFVAVIGSALTIPASADEIILNGKPCNSLCQTWMGVNRSAPPKDSEAKEKVTIRDSDGEQHSGSAARSRALRATGLGSQHSRGRRHHPESVASVSDRETSTIPPDDRLVAKPSKPRVELSSHDVVPAAPTMTETKTKTKTKTPRPIPSERSGADTSYEASARTIASDPIHVTTPTVDDAVALPPQIEGDPEIEAKSPASDASRRASTDGLSRRDPETTEPGSAAPANKKNGPIAAPANSPRPEASMETRSIAAASPDASQSGLTKDSVAQTLAPVPEGERKGEQAAVMPPSPRLDREATPLSTTDVAPAVLIVLAGPDVSAASDLSDKSVVIAGVSSISRAEINDALAAAGASGVELREGRIGDVGQVIGGQASAAIVAFVTPTKAAELRDIPGVTMLRLTVSHPGDD